MMLSMIKNVVRYRDEMVQVSEAIGCAVECCARNYFDNWFRTAPLDLIVMHETAGNTRFGTEQTLIAKKCGVHFIIDRDGTVCQYVDLSLACSHAKGVNNRSIGIEVVNAYNASRSLRQVDATLAGKRLPWWYCPTPAERIGRCTKAYAVPTVAQLDAVKALVPWLCELTGVPLVFPLSGVREVNPAPPPGVVSHRSQCSNRADGEYLIEMLSGAR
jgi:N-acetyl-anhydromuramyl-L-alanine amidase AmpD